MPGAGHAVADNTAFTQWSVLMGAGVGNRRQGIVVAEDGDALAVAQLHDARTAVDEIRELRDVFWNEVKVLGSGDSFNQNLEHAGRLADFLEFAELFATDALHREESCGGHFREEHQTEENEARRDDDNFCYAAAWEFQGVGEQPVLHKEPMEFNEVALSTRSYK